MADDAVASDYVADWNRNRPDPTATLGSLSARVGKEIAHLTYGRLAYTTDEERQWAFTDISKALVGVLNVWFVRAPDYVQGQLQLYLKDYSEQPEVSRPGS